MSDVIESLEPSLSKLRRVSDEESDAWDWEYETLPRLRAAGVPDRFCHRNMELSNEQQETFKECIKVLTNTGAIIALVGPRGVGKTTIAAQIILCHAQDDRRTPIGRKPPYRKLADIVALFKPLYGDYGSRNAENLTARRHWYASFPFMVIDELNECPDQKTRGAVLTDLIDRRYAARNDTLLISNQTVDDFRNTIGESIISRLQEHGCIIECMWDSFRKPA